MTTVCVIQARMGSSRFPGKMLAPLAGKPVLQHVIDRAHEVEQIDRVIVATTSEPIDEPIVRYVEWRNPAMWVYRGSSQHVLHRFYHAAMMGGETETIIRLTGDTPLVDPRLIADAMDSLRLGVHEYEDRTNSPDGTDVEVFTARALMSAYQEASDAYDVEHVTPWMRAHCLREGVRDDPQYADIHYSVNDVETLRLCERLIGECGEGARWQDHVAAIRRFRADGK